jgi:hypothetical protein
MSKKQRTLIEQILQGLRSAPKDKEFTTIELDNGRPLPGDVILSKLRYALGDMAIELGIDFDRKELDAAIFGD